MHKIHEAHSHIHGVGCGHLAVRHGDHVDYLHDGCLHWEHDDHFDEHVIEVSDLNPVVCTAGHVCGGHAAGHVHGDGCGHSKVPHGDHFDYLVMDHLHHAHDGHCDDHGRLSLA
ncbi:MAG: hypothetical protein ACKV22_29880 [Bryobacteraceae bacterium]